ncbi:MAG TPA: YcgN family cysteine cluster protein [Leucothrix sp.]|nr:YcgN family cysteine cluster protein [Leucothrix sp.]
MPAFWKTKSLIEMSREEWESLCDHCGKCCLIKLQDSNDENDEALSVYYTNIVCNLFDMQTGHCSDYQNRETLVPTCLRLTQDNLEQIEWLPPSCAYRCIMEGRGLADWHHLVSGDKNTIHQTGNSVLRKIVFEKDTEEEQLEEHIVEWPLN